MLSETSTAICAQHEIADDIHVSAHRSECANTVCVCVCGDHFNEVISLQTHTFPIKKRWEMEVIITAL